jgi:hypothetical protein
MPAPQVFAESNIGSTLQRLLKIFCRPIAKGRLYNASRMRQKPFMATPMTPEQIVEAVKAFRFHDHQELKATVIWGGDVVAVTNEGVYLAKSTDMGSGWDIRQVVRR